VAIDPCYAGLQPAFAKLEVLRHGVMGWTQGTSEPREVREEL
jgi:hypothetical protein